MWEEIGKYVVGILLGFLATSGVFLIVIKKGKKWTKVAREGLDVVDATLDAIDPAGEEGIKPSAAEWAKGKKEIHETIAAVKDALKK